MTDPIADFFTQLRNAASVGKETLSLPASKVKEQIAHVLAGEGFVSDVKTEQGADGHAVLTMLVQYDASGNPVLKHIERVSKPGRRVSSGYRDLRPVRQGLGVTLLSTSQGFMTDVKARKENIGGEVIGIAW